MSSIAPHLPRLDGHLFLTDGGLETSLIFHHGLDLPCFAAFPLVLSEAGRLQLDHYFQPFLRTAARHRLGFVLDTPTWRANADWGARLGFSAHAMNEVNREAVTWAQALRAEHAAPEANILINGVLGPRGDGYKVEARMSAQQAQDYHRAQITSLTQAGAELISAYTLNYSEEAIGIVRAAAELGIPLAISFTVETDGKLASGESLGEAIQRTDQASATPPLYFMINCAHPTHFENVLDTDADWLRRIGGLRANASAKSHAELDASEALDDGDPLDLGRRYQALRKRLPQLSVLGGCCGTDHRHVAAICEACLAP